MLANQGTLQNDLQAASNSAHSSMWYAPRRERVLAHQKILYNDLQSVSNAVHRSLHGELEC